MREAEIPLNPIISSSINTHNSSEHLLSSNNDNDKLYINNTNIYNYSPVNSKNIQISNKKSILVRSSAVVTISYQGKMLQRVDDKIILCYKRRKLPEKRSYLNGYKSTLIFFVFFSILFTIFLSKSKNINAMKDSISSSYNYIMIFMWIFSILSMITLTDVAFADPGRQRGTPIIQSKFESAKIRKIVGGKKYFLKYCTTCNLIRDIRTFHCNKCNLCVEKHDHHCGYVSNCIGVYNYKKFFIFIIFAYVHVTIILFTCIHFCFKFGGNLDNGEEYLLFIFIFIMVFGGFFSFFIFWMIVQHIQIIVINRTTREFIKHKEYKVYDRGCKKNCHEALCQSLVKEM